MNSMLRPLHHLACIGLLASATAFAPADVYALNFNVVFQDVENNNGIGFDDAVEGAARRATLLATTDYLSSVIDNTGTIDLSVNNSQLDGSGALGNGGTYFFTSPNGFTNGLAFEHATTGQDPLSGAADAFVRFDFGYNWNSGLGGPASDEHDLFSVALHELGHSLGFLNVLRSDGTSNITGTDPGVYTVFESMVQTASGSALFAAGGDFIGDPADVASAALQFTGANAVAANGGQAIDLVTQTTSSGRISFAHLDGGQISDAVLQPSLMIGTARREFTNVELGILRDLGYAIASDEQLSGGSAAAVSAPSSLLLMMLAGLMAAGLRRKTTAASAC